MLTRTFVHIPGIGAKYEYHLWNRGILSWFNDTSQFLEVVQGKKREVITEYIQSSLDAYYSGSVAYFTDLLQSKEQWRVFNDFRNRAVYLDIETNGYRDITCITLYDGKNLFWYVNGINLHEFVNDIKRYDLLITFNGKAFDVPMIEKFFSVSLKHGHIDLMHVLRNIGLRGGLKNIEKTTGIDRKDLCDLDGYDAVILWNIYRRTGNRKALDTLLAYNMMDVLNLEPLMVLAYNTLLGQLPIIGDHEELLPQVVSQPEIPFQPDKEVIALLKGYRPLEPDY